MDRGPRLSKNRRVSVGLYLGSDANTIRKNLSLVANAKRGTLNTGWYGMGNPFSASMPNTAEIPPKRIVISKVATMNAGHEWYGVPPPFMWLVDAEIQYSLA